MSKYTGKTVLITGGAKGIGLCTAREFARAGAEIILTDFDGEALAKARLDLQSEGAKVHAYVCDVSKQDKVEEMAADIMSRLGAPDVLINNAGIGFNAELAETPMETWKKLMDVDFWGTLYHVYAFLPAMMERRSGQIINVSSGQAYFQMPTWGAYASIKAGLGVFSEILHFELRKFGIHVTTVYPFMADTGFYKDAKKDTFGAKMSMKLLPYYSNSPETVGRIIYKAALKKKSVERVHPLNDVGFYSRFFPHVSMIMSFVTERFLGKSADEMTQGK